jgi:hypothetical protein
MNDKTTAVELTQAERRLIYRLRQLTNEAQTTIIIVTLNPLSLMTVGDIELLAKVDISAKNNN